jgi:hypothetical protein
VPLADGQKRFAVHLRSAEGAIFPITKSKLPLHEISDYWSREIQPPASQNELYAFLERAWWLGEIHGGVARLEILKRMFKSMRHRDDLGIVFVVDGDPAPPDEELPDGGVRVDIRYIVPVPSSDTDTWNEVNCADAFDALAQTPSTESYQLMGISLRYIELTWAEFNGWCRKRGYQVPSFWAPTEFGLIAAQMTRSGGPGRPSSKHLIENELKRRADNGEIPAGATQVSIAKELADWYENDLRKKCPELPTYQWEFIRRHLRPAIRRAIDAGRN